MENATKTGSVGIPKTTIPDKTVHILLTQCLQNGFFLSEDSTLSLPSTEVHRMLIGDQEDGIDDSNPFKSDAPQNRHTLKDTYKQGPLYKFLETVIDKKQRQSDLHVIHLRDWHELSPAYDKERRLYGGHCEANTWEAEPIDGFEAYLKPWGNVLGTDEENHPHSLYGWGKRELPKVRYYEVLSDSVFDFRYAQSIKYMESVDEACRTTKGQSHLSVLLNKILDDAGDEAHVYVTVIGVYTDIKVRTLLTGLRSRYNEITNLMVSDVLTSAPDIDRHLGALDFISKVLNVEVVSNLNIIVSLMDKDRIINGKSTEEEPIPIELTQNSLKWRDYKHYYLDKQRVLAYQDQRLAHYLDLTTERSNRLYKQIESVNVWLTHFGRGALMLLFVMIVISILGVEVPLVAFAATGLVSVGQIVPVFIDAPQKRLQENLATLVRLRNYLESYSLVSALLRHHLTSPLQLSSKTNDEDEVMLRKRNERIKDHMEIVSLGAAALRSNFGEIHVDVADNLSVSSEPTDINNGQMG